MYVCITNTKTNKSKVVNAVTACDIIGVENSGLYRMRKKGTTEYRHFILAWDVEIVKNKPRGKSYQKGQSGYISAIFNKVK